MLWQSTNISCHLGELHVKVDDNVGELDSLPITWTGQLDDLVDMSLWLLARVSWGQVSPMTHKDKVPEYFNLQGCDSCDFRTDLVCRPLWQGCRCGVWWAGCRAGRAPWNWPRSPDWRPESLRQPSCWTEGETERWWMKTAGIQFMHDLSLFFPHTPVHQVVQPPPGSVINDSVRPQALPFYTGHLTRTKTMTDKLVCSTQLVVTAERGWIIAHTSLWRVELAERKNRRLVLLTCKIIMRYIFDSASKNENVALC